MWNPWDFFFPPNRVSLLYLGDSSYKADCNIQNHDIPSFFSLSFFSLSYKGCSLCLEWAPLSLTCVSHTPLICMFTLKNQPRFAFFRLKYQCSLSVSQSHPVSASLVSFIGFLLSKPPVREKTSYSSLVCLSHCHTKHCGWHIYTS